MILDITQVPASVRNSLHILSQVNFDTALAVNKGKLALFLDSYQCTVQAGDPWAQRNADGFTMDCAITGLVSKSCPDFYGEVHAVYGILVDAEVLVTAIMHWADWAYEAE